MTESHTAHQSCCQARQSNKASLGSPACVFFKCLTVSPHSSGGMCDHSSRVVDLRRSQVHPASAPTSQWRKHFRRPAQALLSVICHQLIEPSQWEVNQPTISHSRVLLTPSTSCSSHSCHSARQWSGSIELDSEQ